MKYRKLLTAVVITLGIICSTVKFSYAEQDAELWNSVAIKFKLNDKTSLIIEPKFQSRDDASDFYYWESVQGLKYKLHKNVDVGLFYLYADKQSTGGVWTKENRGRAEVTLKETFGSFKISDRNRYEYRVVGGSEKTRYRNRIQIARPLEFKGHKLTPYVSNEFFYDNKDHAYNQNRATFGINKKINDTLTAGAYFLLQTTRSGGGDWGQTNVFGTKMSFSL